MSELNLTANTEGLAVARRQVVRDVMSHGHSAAEAEKYAEKQIPMAKVRAEADDANERRYWSRR